MYVCLCNGYRESELRELARRGISDAEDAYLALGDGPCCGSCVDFAQGIMDAERGQVGVGEVLEDKAA
jgi:bacterioferritin-associated ferredoxin